MNLHFLIWLVISTPLKNMSSSVGMMTFPIYGKHVPNHQPVGIWHGFPSLDLPKMLLLKSPVYPVCPTPPDLPTSCASCEAAQRFWVPSGKRTTKYGTSPFFIGKSSISVAIFNSYVSLPEGNGSYLCSGLNQTEFDQLEASNFWQVFKHVVGLVWMCESGASQEKNKQTLLQKPWSFESVGFAVRCRVFCARTSHRDLPSM